MGAKEAERKQQRKDAKAALKAHASESGESTEGVTEILQHENATSEPPRRADQATKEDIPMLLDPSIPHLDAVLNHVDVLIQILDVRDPLPCRSIWLEQNFLARSQDKKLAYVLNKIGEFSIRKVNWGAFKPRLNRHST